jgi:hypothetical protein
VSVEPEETKPEEATPEDSRCACGCAGDLAHPCPYKEEICGDSETLCVCCGHCWWACADDV